MLCEKSNFWKITQFHTITTYLYDIMLLFYRFRLSVCLYLQEVLCRISNIFRWQTIRDLSKKSWPLQISDVLWKIQLFQNRVFSYKIPHICVSYCYYLSISRFKCFGKSKFFKIAHFRVNWTYLCSLSRFFGHFWFSVFWKIQFIGNRPFLYKVDVFMPFITVIWTFCDFQWIGTSERCLAESQIFFLDKQSETCQNNLGLLKFCMCCKKSKLLHNHAFRVKIPRICVIYRDYLNISQFQCFRNLTFWKSQIFTQMGRICGICQCISTFL